MTRPARPLPDLSPAQVADLSRETMRGVAHTEGWPIDTSPPGLDPYAAAARWLEAPSVRRWAALGACAGCLLTHPGGLPCRKARALVEAMAAGARTCTIGPDSPQGPEEVQAAFAMLDAWGAARDARRRVEREARAGTRPMCALGPLGLGGGG